MKWRYIGVFILGSLTGSALVLGWDKVSLSKISEPEHALGEVFYQELQKYPKECRVGHVTHIMQELAHGKRQPHEEEKRDRILMDFAAEKAERVAAEHLFSAEEYLSRLAKKEGIRPVIEAKVYTEILEEGTGSTIAATDVVSLYFKQYDKVGNLIKDSGNEKPFSIPLSRMIKGFKLGMEGAKVGEKRKIYIHPEYGFGKLGRGQETNQLLIYEITLVEKIEQSTDLLKQ